jgi:threonine dehydrogenase-like Zn-dependent dehydrogenase
MRGVWLEHRRVSARADLRRPEATPGDAIVRVLRAGICGTDLELLGGYAGFRGIPGHEFVGVVECGPPGWLGARVVSEINVTCASYSDGDPPRLDGACASCRAGRPAHCVSRTVVGIRDRDGAFAERVALPVRNLHRVPDLISDDAAVFVEPLAAALRVLEQVDIGPQHRVIIIGPGRLGLLVARALAPVTRDLEVAGRSPAGLERAAASGIATRSVDDIPPGEYDIAVDCTGHPEGFARGREALRAGGTLVLKSTYAGSSSIEAAALVVDEIRIVGSRCGPFPAAIDALAAAAVRVDDLVDGTYPLEDAASAFDRAARPGIGKILLTV